MSKDTARQEVEQVCFAYEKAGKTGNKKDWGKFYDLEEPLIKKVEFANQPKISMPKKIADALDKLEFDWDMMAFPNSSQGDYQDLFDYIDRGNAPIIMTYLASKAVGVELVEVSDE